jgi:adenosylcobinamide kinase / adenosylcobinamide-phosphate guanylyltransferase
VPLSRTPKARPRTQRSAPRPTAAARAAITLVLGGVRSGKSLYAETLALDLAQAHGRAAKPLYVATADAELSRADAAMTARIARHRARRGRAWAVIEAPLDIAGALAKAGKSPAVLVDSLTLWLGNLLAAGRPPARETARLMAALAAAAGPVILVSDEVGLGGIAANPLARDFADALGALNQRVAAAAGRVVLVAAGIPLILKDLTKGSGS